MTEAILVDDRAMFVRDRLIAINKSAGDLILENGLLLRELMTNGMYKELGFASFDEAVEIWHDRGFLDYGARQARNFVAVVDMFDKLTLPEDRKNLGMSKLRQIASLKKNEPAQRALLDRAPDMSVAEVEQECKAIRDKAAGRDVDPLDPYNLRLTKSQRDFMRECIDSARRVYSIDDNVPLETVLVDTILAEWFAGVAS